MPQRLKMPNIYVSRHDAKPPGERRNSEKQFVASQ
jgi:hypothetical protein